MPLKYGIQTSFSFQSLPGYRFGTAALNIDTGIVAGPSGQPGATSLATPNGAGHGVADHADDALHASARGTPRRRAVSSARWSIPGMTVASLSVPLVAPMTEFGDRINQLDLNVSKTFSDRPRQLPAEDRLLQPAECLAGLRRPAPLENYGTTAYMQPSSILVGRVFQLGAIVKF